MGRSDGFPLFVVDQADRLARTAFLLTGDPARARELTVRTLVAIGRRWPEVRWRAGDAMVRELYRTYLRLQPTAPPEDFPLARMSPVGRAALVTQFYDGLPEPVAALVCELHPAALRQETVHALAQLRALQPPPEETKREGPPEFLPPASGMWTPPSSSGSPPPAVHPSPRADPTLTELAAKAPPLDVTDEVLRALVRRRRTTYGVATAVSVTLVALLVGGAIVGVNYVTERLELANVAAAPTGTTDQLVPDPLPDKLAEPIAYAYIGYCVNSEDETGPCAMWRVVTLSGVEWLVPEAKYTLQDDGLPWPLQISQDGKRLAYVNSAGGYAVRDLPTGESKTVNVQIDGTNPTFVLSPNGRFAGVRFHDEDIDTDPAVLDFASGVTTYFWEDHLLALRDDKWLVTADREEGPILSLQGPKYRSYDTRLDFTLINHGSALAPDGRTLALISDDQRLTRVDAQTGKIAKERPSFREDLPEVDSVLRWLGNDEVLVRLLNEDDYVALAAVNVRTGKSRPYELDGSDEIDYSTVLGKLE